MGEFYQFYQFSSKISCQILLCLEIVKIIFSESESWSSSSPGFIVLFTARHGRLNYCSWSSSVFLRCLMTFWVINNGVSRNFTQLSSVIIVFFSPCVNAFADGLCYLLILIGQWKKMFLLLVSDLVILMYFDDGIAIFFISFWETRVVLFFFSFALLVCATFFSYRMYWLGWI